MSASVWFEEVSTGLLEELFNTVRIKDVSGVLVPLPRKAFIVREPEEDFKFETYPCVSIYNLDYRHNPLRYLPFPVAVGNDKEHHLVTLEDHAVPFDLNYQIDFWSKYQTDMDDMTRTWFLKHFRQFNLPVIDSGGNQRTCNCNITQNIYRSDLIEDKERIFHAFAKYRIWVEIDEETSYNASMVTEVVLDASEENMDKKRNES